MPRIFHFTLLSLSVILAACANLAPVPSDDNYWLKADAQWSLSVVDSALAYYAYTRTLGAADWGRENEALKNLTARKPDEFNRLRQIILLMAPATPLKERGRALPLLEKLDKDVQKSSATLQPLIALLRSELEERRRLEDKLRDEGKKNEELEQKLEAQKAAEKELLQKLNALKAIEKNLLDRRHAAPTVSKP